jgi:hypothetical protein
MNAEIFAEWLRRQGFKIYQTPQTYWCEINSRAFQAFPYHWIIQPSEQELAAFIRQSRARVLRFSTPVESAAGMVSYHIVYTSESYLLDELDRRTRQNVRKGLKNCRIQPVSMERLAQEGWALEEDTVKRQGRNVAVAREKWQRRYRSAADLPGFEGWGALVGDRLAAALLTCQIDDCCEMISQQCHSDFLQARVNNALIYSVTEIMVYRPEIREIFYTMQSLDAPPRVDEFKLRMGYSVRPVRQRVVFATRLAPILVPAASTLVSGAVRLRPENPDLTKLQGLLHFYQAGKRPLNQQDWPEFLQKENPSEVSEAELAKQQAETR